MRENSGQDELGVVDVDILEEVFPTEMEVVVAGDQDDFWKVLVLLVLHDLAVRRLLGQKFPSSRLQDGLHGGETGADPWGQEEELPLEERSAVCSLQRLLQTEAKQNLGLGVP